MLSVIMLSVIMLSVIMLSVIMLNVAMLSVIMLSVVMLGDVAPCGQCYKTFLTSLPHCRCNLSKIIVNTTKMV